MWLFSIIVTSATRPIQGLGLKTMKRDALPFGTDPTTVTKPGWAHAVRR